MNEKVTKFVIHDTGFRRVYIYRAEGSDTEFRGGSAVKIYEDTMPSISLIVQCHATSGELLSELSPYIAEFNTKMIPYSLDSMIKYLVGTGEFTLVADW